MAAHWKKVNLGLNKCLTQTKNSRTMVTDGINFSTKVGKVNKLRGKWGNGQSELSDFFYGSKYNGFDEHENSIE